ncbi:MAG: LtrC-like protein [Lachnospiraceae bacterium]|nr:LtrC-like protein [Lachnospiraceae bacterium]
MTDNFTPEKTNPAPKMSLEDWKAMKDQEKSDVFKLLDQTTLDLAEVPGCFLRYLDTQARMNRYTVSNALLISAQMPEATKLRTFAEWEKEDAKIKKGSKSISILEPSEFKKADGTSAIAYNVKKVFDISQTSKAEEVKPYQQKDIAKLIAAMLDTCPVSIDLATEIPVPGTAAYFDKASNTLYVQKEGGTADYVCQCVARELGFIEASLRSPDADRSASHADAVITGYLVCKRYGVPTESLDAERAASKYKGMNAKDVRKDLSELRSSAAKINDRIYGELYKEKAPRSKGSTER